MVQLWRGGPEIDAGDLCTQTIDVVAKRGAGKTYTAGKIAELLIGAGFPVIIFDPVGVWYGLRIAKDGKSTSGLDVPVFGGQHGELPLDPKSGALVADALCDHGTSAVLDVSWFESKSAVRRFVVDFVTRFMTRQRRSRRPVHTILEEAQEFVPQWSGRGNEENAQMLGAIGSMVKLGRNFGIGNTLVTQRPQSCSKDVFNQAEMLIVGQLTGPQEKKAIVDWVRDKGADGESLLDSLPKLSKEQKIVWSPTWLQHYGVEVILPKQTYDASATPTRATAGPVKLPKLDVAKLRDALAAAAEAEPDQAAKRGSKRDDAALAKERDRAQRAEDRLARANDRLARITDRLRDLGVAIGAVKIVEGQLAELLDQTTAHQKIDPLVVRIPPALSVDGAAAKPKPKNGAAVPTMIASTLGQGATLRVFESLAFWHPRKLSRAKLAFHSELRPSGSTFRTALAELRKTPWMCEGPDGFGLTEHGVNVAGDLVKMQPRTKDDVIQFWANKFGAGATGRVFVALVRSGSKGLDRAALARHAELEPTGSTYRTALAELRACFLLDDSSERWTINKELM